MDPDLIDPPRTGIAVINTTTGTLIGAEMIVEGDSTGDLTFNDAGDRAYLLAFSAQSSRLAVINTTTGALVGTPVEGTGGQAFVVDYTDDHSRAFLTTLGDDTHITVINTTNSTQLAQTTTAPGRPVTTNIPPLTLTDNGTAWIVTTEFTQTTLTVINTTTGGALVV